MPDAKALHAFLASLPASQLSVQWGDDHVYKVGGKMFAVASPSGGPVATVSFKAADDSFAILTALPGVRPAPYLARARWVFLDRLDAVSWPELQAYLTRAHAIVAHGLTRKVRADLGL